MSVTLEYSDKFPSESSSVQDVPPMELGGRRHAQFVSRKIKGPVEKPWKDRKVPRSEKWSNYIIWAGWVVGLLVAAAFAYLETAKYDKHQWCLVFEDNFDTFNMDTWNHDIGLGGWGVSSFEWTTADPENSWVENGALHMKPTLNDPNQYKEGDMVNLTATGECTAPYDAIDDPCVAYVNSTQGRSINPFKSSRLTTKDKFSFMYGKIEMRAKMPQGDWLWAAFWMLPTTNTYGGWPFSGEIDIIEMRGNNYTYVFAGGFPAGNNVMNSAIHAGVSYDAHIHQTQKALGSEWHIYGMIWTEKYIKTYIDNELRTVIRVDFEQGALFQQGQSSNLSAPFDQEFYLILNNAVGSANRYFSEEQGSPDKPWQDGSLRLGGMREMYEHRDLWLPSWENGRSEMVIDYIKVWQDCSKTKKR
ncbi:concanavalin A-like lectin/glucanase domain-containing protein [Protomyces lactucae-debilis]|uniref:Concanavalin A-like lectin/glucanase domain-containing protein n=1 Tax=Protomyces lactucae-debilis TaxID=2754530 RepID=A0A1Y2FNH1_PROLT|nr:concanavalin A-like lectin/glucanase domain-containing protein [Protomyces lactucae-debilis]ORY85560.1 concanavalin A-like lectin/glucanase domain-containing protein [Protomyces lactucae-debilis]